MQNALAATAAAWAAGLNPALIARALTTFTTDFSTVPGRFNLFEQNGVEVVINYGHNPGALSALSTAIQALDRRRTVMMITLPGDRRDDDLRASIEATRSCADEYVIYDTRELRGRDVGTIPVLLASFLPPDKPCVLAPDQLEALRIGWQMVRPGDRLITIVDAVDDVLDHLRALGEAGYEDNSCQHPLELEVGTR